MTKITLFFAAILTLSHAEAFISNDPMAVAYRGGLATSFTPTSYSLTSTATTLRMGLIDSVLSRFGNKEEDDFVKLEDMNEQFFGPGPAILLYNIPNTIVDDEVMDMLSDGAPKATQKGISLARIIVISTNTNTNAKKTFTLNDDDSDSNSDHDRNYNEDLMDISLKDALEKVSLRPSSYSTSNDPPPTTTAASTGQQQEGCPVVIFSGFSNTEMMASYNILGEEIYKETAGGMNLACATAVPNAMEKPLRQVITEISGDHQGAMQGQQ